MASRRRIAVWKRLLFAAVTSVGAWLAVEAVVTVLYAAELRAWGSPPPSPQKGVSVLVGNPYLIYEYPPGEHFERGVKVTINSLGLRGPEPEIPKPAGVRRLITTGDSSVFGFGVQDEEVFSSVAARELGDDVEPIVAAVPGYSSYQSLNLLRMRALRTDPDLFVIGNIWSDNNFDAFVDRDTIATLSGYEQSVKGAMKRILTKSAVYRVADWKLRVRDRMRSVERIGWQTSSQDRGQIGLRRVAIQDYADNLEHLANIADSRGADAVFLLLANNEDLGPGGTAGANMKAWTPYREVMRDTATRHGAPVLDVPALFRETGLSKEDLFLDQMHPTARGHQIIGEALAALLDEEGWTAGQRMMGDGPGGSVPEYVDPFLKGQASHDPSAAQDGPPVGAGGDAVRIEGTVKAEAYESGVIHIDAYVPGAANPTVLTTIKLQGPGPFVIPLGQPQTVVLRAYLDSEGDGPDADDPAFDFKDHPFELTKGPASAVTLDLDAGTVR